MHQLRYLLLFFLFGVAGKCSNAQQYLLFFRHKAATNQSLQQPLAYLSAQALQRRQRYSIPVDSSDLPVPEAFLSQLRDIQGLAILQSSRWLNAVAVQATSAAAIQQAQQLPFVAGTRLVRNASAANNRVYKSMQGNAAKRTRGADQVYGQQEDFYQYGNGQNQVALHKGNFLHNIGLRGQGMTIGILDAGFFRYNQIPAFDSVRTRKRVLGTWDFVANDSSVSEDNAHGMQCFSIMAANMPGRFVGTAPDASYYLFRTEDAARETQLEEFSWVVAAERLDSAGTHIISSSLGYNQFDKGLGNYTYADLNGDKTITVQGADLAAKKGMLVVNSAGNAGNGTWKYIATPADGDSVLAVGAVNTGGLPASFSSYGPTADGRIKPDVAALGVSTTLVNSNGTIGNGNGTSFACPVMAGLAACLWEGFPESSNWQIIAALRRSGNIADAPNDRVGYGIPDVQKATGLLLKDFATAAATVDGCLPTITWQSKDMHAMQYVVERRDPANNWQKVGTVRSLGETWGTNQYKFTDGTGTPGGTATYRIRQVLDTAAASLYAIYLDTVQVSISGNCQAAGNRLRIVSAPEQNGTTLLFNFPEAIDRLNISWYNNLGQQLGSVQGSKPSGILQQSIPTGRLPPGSYLLRVADGSQQIGQIAFLKL